MKKVSIFFVFVIFFILIGCEKQQEQQEIILPDDDKTEIENQVIDFTSPEVFIEILGMEEDELMLYLSSRGYDGRKNIRGEVNVVGESFFFEFSSKKLEYVVFRDCFEGHIAGIDIAEYNRDMILEINGIPWSSSEDYIHYHIQDREIPIAVRIINRINSPKKYVTVSALDRFSLPKYFFLSKEEIESYFGIQELIEKGIILEFSSCDSYVLEAIFMKDSPYGISVGDKYDEEKMITKFGEPQSKGEKSINFPLSGSMYARILIFFDEDGYITKIITRQ